MTTTVVVVLLRPLLALVLALVILYPIRRLVEKYMKDGKLKRLLLFRIN